MRLNVNRLLHTPDASQEVRFEMDLSQLDFGGAAPIIRPVTVEGRIRNQAGVLLCQLEMHTTLHCVCDRCMEEFDEPKTVRYECLCPGCGVNLNREPCRCKKQVDPRLAKLASLLQEKE